MRFNVVRRPYYLPKEEIKTHIPKSIQCLLESKCGAAAYDLDIINDYFYAIVLGWTPSDDDELQDDGYYDDGYRLTIRIGRLPLNSGMWCDLDFDWLLPPLNEEGDLWDTDEYLYPDSDTDKLVDELFKEWEEMKKFYKEHNI